LQLSQHRLKHFTGEGEIVQGSPAFNIGDYKRTYVCFFENCRLLEKKIEEHRTNHAELNAITLLVPNIPGT
jgi:hypothetical protein